MSKPVDGVSAVNELRLKVDELATTLLLNGPDASVATGLKQLADAAALAGFSSIAAIASGLVTQVSTGSGNTVQSEQALREGFSTIQASLDLPLNEGPGDAAASVAEAAQSFAMNSLAQDSELVGDFILEAREHLTAVENNMLTLERNPEEREAVHAVFRGFHTIKGLAGFLEFMPIRDVAHEVETLLDDARNGKLAITGSVVDVVLESVDYLKQSIEAVEASLQGKEAGPVQNNAALITRIQRISSGEQVHEPVTSAPALAKLAESVQSSNAPVAEQAPVREVKKETPAAEPHPAAEAASSGNTENRTKADASAVIRVQTAKLDYLMDMVGEMVITQSLIRHNPAISSLQNAKLMADISQLARITGEVQRTTMGMRMITLGQVFQRSTRLIRDLSRKQGKNIQVEVSGEETEVDKTIAEELTDPLLHMVRNACDHGVDTPEERAAAGKPVTATIKLAAYHQGGQIVIEIADDGRGLHRDKILAKAVQKGLIEPNAHLSEQEIFNLIFEPGFSTAAQVTDLSGRGVGMDVVRRNIQKLRGRIDIQSKQGKGTTFFLRLPLTLAIIEGLVVGVGENRYIVPIYAVRELISPKSDILGTVHGRNETAMVRNQVLPVLRLSKRFNVKPRSEDPCQGLLVVTESQEQPFCLLVDEVLGKQEVVIKSLGETLKDISGIAGAAILGDGRVGLILDLEGVFRGNKP
jgi:two-component system, chemotaxis family, sensor kinase CheA